MPSMIPPKETIYIFLRCIWNGSRCVSIAINFLKRTIHQWRWFCRLYAVFNVQKTQGTNGTSSWPWFLPASFIWPPWSPIRSSSTRRKGIKIHTLHWPQMTFSWPLLRVVYFENYVVPSTHILHTLLVHGPFLDFSITTSSRASTAYQLTNIIISCRPFSLYVCIDR